jgi:hypothetical protein
MDKYLHRLQESIAFSVRGISESDLIRRPPGKWSIAEIVEHLYLTYTATSKGCERALASSSPALRPTLKERLFIFVVVDCGHMPKGRKASERNSPRGTTNAGIVQKITPQLAALDEVLARCEQRYGKRTRFMNHPVLGPLSVPQWRKFHWVHGRHHIRQILALRRRWAEKEKAPNRPGAQCA